MIKKSFITAILIFLAYTLLCSVWTPSFISPQGFWQDNQVKAQRYTYTNKYDLVENVIVGSSMAFRLPEDELKGACNLAFLGESYHNGLELMLRKGQYPKRIYLEATLASGHGVNGMFYEILDNPVFHPLRKIFPSMRDGYQPFLVFASYLENQLSKCLDENKRDKYATIFRSLSEPMPGVGLLSSYSTPMSKKDQLEVIGNLKKVTDKFEAHGTQIILFEMPLYRTVYYAPMIMTMREGFRDVYPETEYHYMPRPAYDEYETLDGIHLGKEEASIFIKQFLQHTDSINAIPDN